MPETHDYSTMPAFSGRTRFTDSADPTPVILDEDPPPIPEQDRLAVLVDETNAIPTPLPVGRVRPVTDPGEPTQPAEI